MPPLSAGNGSAVTTPEKTMSSSGSQGQPTPPLGVGAVGRSQNGSVPEGEPATPRNQGPRPGAPIRIALWILSCILWWFFIGLPHLVMKRIPHAPGALSIAFLFFFAQALGLMWLLVVNLCSIFCVHFVEDVHEHMAGRTLSWADVFYKVCGAYVRYCIARILFFVGSSFYAIGWEGFADFPAVQRLVVGSTSKQRRESQIPVLPLDRTLSLDEADGLGTSPPPPHLTRQTSMSSENDGDDTVGDLGKRFDRMGSSVHRSQSWSSGGSGCESARDNAALRFAAARTTRNEVTNGAPPKVKRRRRFFRHATLLAPLVGLIVCHIAISAVVFACTAGALHCDRSAVFDSLTSPTGRLNRGTRYTIFIAFLQWAQQFVYLFPKWDCVLRSTRLGMAWGIVAMVLIPLSMFRLGYWFVHPAGTGVTQDILYIPHHVVDVLLILFWMSWWLGTCFIVLDKPEAGGFDKKKRLFGEEGWTEMTILFKYTFVVPTLLHFARGMWTFGWEGAQNDFLVITTVYPMLLATVWTLVWAIVVAPRLRLLFAGMIGTAGLATTMCMFAGFQRGATMILVGLHMMRQYLKFFPSIRAKRRIRREREAAGDRGRSMTLSSASSGVNFDGSPRKRSKTANVAKEAAGRQGDRERPPDSSRESKEVAQMGKSIAVLRGASKVYRLDSFVAVLAGLILLCFSGVLVSLAAVSSLQTRIDLYPTTIWYKAEASPATTQVDHLISRLRLRALEEDPKKVPKPWSNATGAHKKPSYAACGHHWHGLSVMDFSLLSLAAYFDRTDPSLELLLKDFFPERAGFSWRITNSSTAPAMGVTTSRLSWLEVEIQTSEMEKPNLVIAVRGTDPVRFNDYIENIRMWTEPVAMSILSTVLPSARIWPRRTAEMVIAGIHDFLDAVGLPDDQWSYTGLLDHVDSIQKSKYGKVVLTGHSLGGGVATVVSALKRLPVVGITPPGIYYSIAKHNRINGQQAAWLEADVPEVITDASSWIHHESLTMIVENDFVNGIFDGHGGLVQTMTCDRSKESVQMACHMLEGTVCHLFNRCGDPWRRWDHCAHEFVLKDEISRTTAKVIMDMLPGVVPEKLMEAVANFESWIESPYLPDPKRAGMLLLALLVVVIFIASAAEELLLL
eukprot:TRINITY_DN51676_c0_g1_i1.p1 TRINITY_DN51676_c0_g1~~TRINITY_DN51676_c0_g1_i1.p1  ORF type:complete len:1130 (+),score=227.18 TRINITY_DN51676_c0_g1_i1:70-3459(+)